MKTSELINKLQESLENDGDLEVHIHKLYGKLIFHYVEDVINGNKYILIHSLNNESLYS